MTYQTFIKEQTKRIKGTDLEKEAIKLLVLELSGLDGAHFLMKLNDEIEEEIYQKLLKAVDEYIINRKPVQHIIGYSYFYGYKMIVNENVLIPRPETEELVGYVLSYYDEVFDGAKVNLVDVGTGSGAIAITLSKEEPNMTVSATDISHEALLVAKQNAARNDATVTFYEGDMLCPLLENNLKFDILVSNPPYIPDDEYVEDIVKNNEPHVALFGGVNGMYFYDVILKDANKILNTPNIIAFEHSYNKKAEMHELIKKYFPNSTYETIKDLSGKDRMTIIINKESK